MTLLVTQDTILT